MFILMAAILELTTTYFAFDICYCFVMVQNWQDKFSQERNKSLGYNLDIWDTP